jgi:rhombotail lipoprotein
MNRLIVAMAGMMLASAIVGCASMEKDARQRQVSSVLAYLYPGKEQVPPGSQAVAEIVPPVRIGVAFVPDNNDPHFRLPESERLRLADKVKAAFSDYSFIKEIVPVPSVYLEAGGGFANLDRVAALLRLDQVALISFDQVQNAGATESSFLYWTGVGAYLVSGDRYDILTSVETSVFDIKSRRLLMRAGGISNVKGSATMVGFSELSREARSRGFDEAMKEMITKLRGEVQVFLEEAPKDPSVRIIRSRK